MQPSLWHSNLEEFRERVASTDSTIAAVAVSAISAAYAAGLVVMVLDVIGKRKNFEGDRQRLETLAEAAREESDRLARYADEDPAAYAGYMRAIRLPKSTEAERAERENAKAAALRRATDVPLSAARAAIAALNICAEAAEVAHGAVAADLGGSASLLSGAIRAMLCTVDANLAALRESEYRDLVAAERAELEQRADRQEKTVRKRVASL
jgi:formiminotetrahydrofolate cyclodeaminase